MWRRVGQLLIGLLLCSPLVRAQGVIYRSVATGKRLSGDTFVTVPLPGASVRVCTGVQTAVPCTPLAQIYGDQGLTVVSPNPLTADQNGNYFFWAQPGTYTVQIFHPLAPVSTFSVVLSPALGSTNTWTAPNTFTAPVSFSGPMTFSGSTTVQSSLTLATPNAATATQAQNSPPLAFTGAYWNGTASASDTWTLQDVVAAGTNGSSGLVIGHAGSPSNYIQLNAAVGINKVPATALDVSGGLGVSGNASIGGSLTLGTPLAVSSGGTGTATASANTIFAGPSSGAAAAPSFRSLVAADIPAGNSCPSGRYATALGAALTLSCAQVAYSQISGTPTLYYQSVQANGTAQTQRTVLNLVSGSNASVSCADDATNNRTSCTVSAVGTVTSVGLAAPAQFTVTGSPVTSSGTLTLGWASQNANTVLAGPTSGVAAAPSFRALVAADIPAGTSCPSGQYATSLGAGLVLTCAQVAYSQISGTPTLFYQTVQANGTAQTQRPTLNFVSGSNASVSCADDATNNRTSCTVSAVGTVTSVGLSAPSQFTVTGSPVTGAGTLTLAWASQTANTVLAGPTSGAAAAPTFRALVGADIPPINLAAGGNGGVTGVLPTQNGGTGNSQGLIPQMNGTVGVPYWWQSWTVPYQPGATLPTVIAGIAHNVYASASAWVIGTDGCSNGGAAIISAVNQFSPLALYNFQNGGTGGGGCIGNTTRTLTSVYPIAEFDGDSGNSSPTRGNIRLWGSVGIGKSPSTTLDVSGNASISGSLTVTGTLSAPGVPVVVYATPSATLQFGTGIASTTVATAGANGNLYEISAVLVVVAAGSGCTSTNSASITFTGTDARAGATLNMTALLSFSGNGSAGRFAAMAPVPLNAAANSSVSYSVSSTGDASCAVLPTYYVLPVVKKLQ
jgi:hypothetical protein